MMTEARKEQRQDVNAHMSRHRAGSQLSFIGPLASEWRNWQQERALPHYHLAPLAREGEKLTPYAIDMDPLLALPFGTLDDDGVLYNRAVGRVQPAAYHPTSIAQYALACWNAYLAGGDALYRSAFLAQACWLLEHEVPLMDGAGGWLMPFAVREYNTPAQWLSALTQGNAISVLVRAYKLTGIEDFQQCAQRALRTFKQEIRDGGVVVALDADGIFFEEVATYPAAHVLNGYILALFGLYDYVAYTGDIEAVALIEHSLRGFHTLIDSFDMGYWSYYDLRFRVPAPLFYHALHVTLLTALARLSGCAHCARLARRWDAYQRNSLAHALYFVVSRYTRYRHGLRGLLARGRNNELAGNGREAHEDITVPIRVRTQRRKQH